MTPAEQRQRGIEHQRKLHAERERRTREKAALLPVLQGGMAGFTGRTPVPGETPVAAYEDALNGVDLIPSIFE